MKKKTLVALGLVAATSTAATTPANAFERSP
jgi:hypothetical protein